MFLPLLLTLATTLPVDWPVVVKPIEFQVVRLEMQNGEDKGICSGVLFNKAKGFAVTAAHCVSHDPSHEFDMTVNGRDAFVVKVNRLLDLAIVSFKPKTEQQMELADVSPEKGADVVVAGFGFGVKEIAFQFGHVTQSFNVETGTLWTDAMLLFGDSGGALVDANGKLVGINSGIYASGPAHIGAVIPVEVIRDFVEEYLPAPKLVAQRHVR